MKLREMGTLNSWIVRLVAKIFQSSMISWKKKVIQSQPSVENKTDIFGWGWYFLTTIVRN